MKKISFLQTLLVLLLYPSLSFPQLYYVSNQGSSDGNGSLTNPFNKISTAYSATVPNGQNEVIKLMPGNYYETNTLVFNNGNITISGYGDGSVIHDCIIVKSGMSFADLYIQGSFSNEEFVIFNNVKCDDSNIDAKSISGAWRDNGNIIHINSLIDPKDSLEAVNLDSIKTHVSNYVAEANFATENNLNTEISARQSADNQLSSDIIYATNFFSTSVNAFVNTNFLSLNGGTLSGQLLVPTITLKGSNVTDYIVSGGSYEDMNGVYKNSRQCQCRYSGK